MKRKNHKSIIPLGPEFCQVFKRKSGPHPHRLTKKIKEHYKTALAFLLMDKYLYYLTDSPIVDDCQFDALEDSFRSIFPNSPYFKIIGADKEWRYYEFLKKYDNMDKMVMENREEIIYRAKLSPIPERHYL